MKQVKLLDCTLRDGGYVNDWNFGHDNIVNIFERLISAKVDMLEIGFLDERRPFDRNRTIMPDTASADRIFGTLSKGDTMVVGMIDYGTCPISHLSPQKDSFLDGIRVIFKKQVRREAIDFCSRVKALGYQVFVQAVSITSYSDPELLDLISMVNELNPYALSMVDTYGLLHQSGLLHYFDLLERHLNQEIAIGYHSHNNFQMAYANSMEMLAKPSDRTILVDASLYGMGKSAGNLPIELISMHMNAVYGKAYNTSQMLEAIDIHIMPFYEKSPWGYSLFYYIAASNNCHPSYVKFLMDKHTLSLKSINQILERIQEEKKLMYDRDYIECLYLEYQNMECRDQEDLARLAALFQGKKLLLLGPGKNMELQRSRVEAFIREQAPVVIAVNYIPEDFSVDYAFLSNSRRYVQLHNRLLELSSTGSSHVQVIATSNVTNVREDFDFTLNYSSLIDREAEIIDNSFAMLLNVLVKTGVSHVSCAGFDGYDAGGDNYFNPDMDYRIGREKSGNLNIYIRTLLNQLKGRLSVDFITDSWYEKNLK